MTLTTVKEYLMQFQIFKTYKTGLKLNKKRFEKHMGKIKGRIVNGLSRISLFFHKRKNKNKDMTIISRDCIGGLVYHQYGLQFRSPTINTFMEPEDFNRFCLNLKEYIDNGELRLDKDRSTQSNPIGLLSSKNNLSLEPVRVYFGHYDSFDDAYKKWESRKKRINWDNLFVISSFCNDGQLFSLQETDL